MTGSQPQGHRSGEGTSDLWSHIRDDEQRKEKVPDHHSGDGSQRQYNSERVQQQQPQQHGQR